MALWACFYCTIPFQDKLSFCFIPQEKIKVKSICIHLTLFCLSVVFLEFFSMSCSVYFKIMEAEFVRTSLCHCLWKKVASWIFFFAFTNKYNKILSYLQIKDQQMKLIKCKFFFTVIQCIQCSNSMHQRNLLWSVIYLINILTQVHKNPKAPIQKYLFSTTWFSLSLRIDFNSAHGRKNATFSFSLGYLYMPVHFSSVHKFIQCIGKYSIHLLSLCSLSLIIASSHFCLSSAVLAMQTNHLFLAVLCIFQPFVTV